jgi:hypothetical protein
VAASKPVGPSPIVHSGTISKLNQLIGIPVATLNTPAAGLAFAGTKDGKMIRFPAQFIELGKTADVAIQQAQKLSFESPGGPKRPLAIAIFSSATNDAYWGSRLVESDNGGALAQRAGSDLSKALVTPHVEALKGVVIGSLLFDLGIGAANDRKPQNMPSLAQILAVTPQPS